MGACSFTFFDCQVFCTQGAAIGAPDLTLCGHVRLPGTVDCHILAEFQFISASPYPESFGIVKGSLKANLSYRALGAQGLGLTLLLSILRIEVDVCVLAGSVFGPITLSRQRWSPQVQRHRHRSACQER